MDTSRSTTTPPNARSAARALDRKNCLFAGSEAGGDPGTAPRPHNYSLTPSLGDFERLLKSLTDDHFYIGF